MVLLNDTLEEEASQPIFPRWTAPGALAATPEVEFTHSKQWLQEFCPQKRRREPPHRSLNPPSEELLLREIHLCNGGAHRGRLALTSGHHRSQAVSLAFSVVPPLGRPVGGLLPPPPP